MNLEGCYENKCGCGKLFYGEKNQPFCAGCYSQRLSAANEIILKVRSAWLVENDPKDGTDCVTPYDEYLYGAGTSDPRPIMKILNTIGISSQLDDDRVISIFKANNGVMFNFRNLGVNTPIGLSHEAFRTAISLYIKLLSTDDSGLLGTPCPACNGTEERGMLECSACDGIGRVI